MRLLVLGASGGVGRWLTRLAAEGGHEITALVRPTTTFDAPANVRVIRGDVLDAATLAAAVQGQDAMLGALTRKTPFIEQTVLLGTAIS